jgi:hypothetical protein
MKLILDEKCQKNRLQSLGVFLLLRYLCMSEFVLTVR